MEQFSEDSITIRFVSSSGFIGWAIRRVTWGVVNHVELVLDGLYGSSRQVIGAFTKDGISIVPYYKVSKEYICKIPCTAEQRGAIFDYAFSQVGKKYDFLDIFGFLVHRDWRKENRWTCGEFVAACFEKGGLPLLHAPLKTINRISPRDVFLSPRIIGHIKAGR